MKEQKIDFVYIWHVIAEHFFYLEKINFYYLLVAMPAVYCLILFIRFNSVLFYIAGLLLVIFAGPGILALIKICDDISKVPEEKCSLVYWSEYRKCLGKGILLGIVLDACVLLVVTPAYFVINTNAGLKTAIFFLCGINVFILNLVLPVATEQLVQDSIFDLNLIVDKVMLQNKAELLLDILSTVWFICILLFPYTCGYLAIGGLPVFRRLIYRMV